MPPPSPPRESQWRRRSLASTPRRHPRRRRRSRVHQSRQEQVRSMESRCRDRAHLEPRLEAPLRAPRRSRLQRRTSGMPNHTMILCAHNWRHFSRRIRLLRQLLLRLQHQLLKHPPLRPPLRLRKKCRWWTWANWGSGYPQRYSHIVGPNLKMHNAAC